MTQISALVAGELDEPVAPAVTRLASAVAARHGKASQAVLFYGSCLRSGEFAGQMLDFYLIVDDYARAYDRRWLAMANRLLPPNVFPIESDGLAAKYAVLSMADFRRLASSQTLNVSVWARFAQPSRLVWRRDAASAAEVGAAVAGAAPAPLAAAGSPPSGEHDPLQWWRRAFSLTYGAELRAERNNRATSIVDLDPDRYRRFTPAVVEALGGQGALAGRATGSWPLRRLQGKTLSVLRLAKAAGTFAGGIDYLAWKINRHAGTRITIKDWQRRHPLLGALTLLPRLLRSGAIR